MTESAAPAEVAVAIIGAGPVGMALALALTTHGMRVLLIDRCARGAWANDPRALALSHGTRQILERLRAWNGMDATPIATIHVSQRGGFGHTRITAGDYDLPALGYVTRYRTLAAALDARLAGECFCSNCTVTTIAPTASAALLTLDGEQQGRQIAAQLVVHAEGAAADTGRVWVTDYRQHAVVAEVRPLAGHGNQAWERFTADGPIALLPLDGNYSLVFTVPPQRAEQLLALDEQAFLAALQSQFGDRLEFAAASSRASFPLALRVRGQLTAERQVWIGNAAQALHPVSGQGFNLGLRDAWELAETLLDEASGDAGKPTALAAYARRRWLDRHGGIAFTDALVRVFSNDFAPLRVARGMGLLAVDLLPPLRAFVAGRMIWGARAWW